MLWWIRLPRISMSPGSGIREPSLIRARVRWWAIPISANNAGYLFLERQRSKLVQAPPPALRQSDSEKRLVRHGVDGRITAITPVPEDSFAGLAVKRIIDPSVQRCRSLRATPAARTKLKIARLHVWKPANMRGRSIEWTKTLTQAINVADAVALDVNIHRLAPVTRNAKSSRLQWRSRRKSADNSVLSRRCHDLAGVLLMPRTSGHPAQSRISPDQSNQSAFARSCATRPSGHDMARIPRLHQTQR